jgi:hypothetical protein
LAWYRDQVSPANDKIADDAFRYAFKIPSVSTENGLGTGRVDHSITFGASEIVAHFNFDFNFTEFLLGQPTASGFDTNQQLALAFSHAIHGKLQFAGEFYGDTQLNPTTPGFASSLWALTYTVVPRLVIDGGFEVGLTTGGPHRHAFLGLTYSIANLYPGWRRKQAQPLYRKPMIQKERASAQLSSWSRLQGLTPILMAASL